MESTTAVSALSALAQESRLAVFRLLIEAGPDGLAAGVIAERSGIAPATLSFHLNQLAHADLVAATRNGRSIVYRANYETMSALMAFLFANCCGGQGLSCVGPEVAAFAEAKESKR